MRRDWFLDSEEYQAIFQETSWVDEINPDLPVKTRISLIFNNITEFKKCKFCSGNIPFNEIIRKTPKYCSKKCSCNSSISKRRESELSRYESLKNSQEIKPLEETLEYVGDKLSKASGQYEREAVYDGYYGSIMHYTDIENIKGLEFKSKMYCLHYDIKELPKCQYCNKEINSFIDVYKGFRTFCSNSCQSRYNSSNRLEIYKDRTGYSHPHKNPDVREGMKEKCQQKWGVDHQFQSQEIRDSIKETNIIRYGDENYNNRKKAQATNLKKYGTPYLLCDQEWKESKMLEKYGVKHYSQLGITNGYKWYEYELPSGRIIKYQGYEGRYIPVLLRKYEEDEIVFNSSEVPRIKYILDGKERYYFPDFYIPKDNLLIEIKSEFTLNANKEMNEAKFKATVEQGFNFKLKVY